MLSKAKYIFAKTPKSFLKINSFQLRNFSTKEVMNELNMSKSQIKELNHLIKSPWVKPGKEKLVTINNESRNFKTKKNFLFFLSKLNSK